MTLSLEQPTRPHAPAIRLGHRSSFLLGVTTIFGVAAFAWPLLIHQTSSQNAAHSSDAPWIFVALVPLLIAIVMAELSEGGIDAKAIALLGILAACFSALRIASPGIDGFEPEWFLLILSGRVFGTRIRLRTRSSGTLRVRTCHRGHRSVAPVPNARRRLDRLRCRVSPRLRGFSERLLLAAYGAVGALVYGALTNFWFWPFVGSETRYSFVPGAGTASNLHRFLLFDLTTSWGST